MQSMLCMQGKGILPSQRPLPSLPGNARYVYHDNVCYDWGTFGFALGNSVPDVAIYKYIVFMNSSIRGPHLPAYWPVSLHSTTRLSPFLVTKRQVMELLCCMLTDDSYIYCIFKPSPICNQKPRNLVPCAVISMYIDGHWPCCATAFSMMLRILIPCEDTDAHTFVIPCLPCFACQLLDLPQVATRSDRS